MQDTGELVWHQLESRLSRSGAKETTLDYARDFAERRGIVEAFGVKSEIEFPRERIDFDHNRKIGQERQPLRRQDRDRLVAEHSVDEERARIQADPVSAKDPTQDIVADWQQQAEKPEPLVPAITRHDRSIEDVAREKAIPTFNQYWEAVESVSRHVFRDATEVTGRLRSTIIDQGGDGKVMAKAMAEQPERFGDLRGKSGLLGDNKERKVALRYARSVAAHLEASASTWERRLGEERKSERWQRDKRDQLIDHLRSTPEGKAALEEARQVAKALERRFGNSDPRDFAKGLEQRPERANRADEIRAVARMVERTRMAELSRDHTLKQELTRLQGLGLSR